MKKITLFLTAILVSAAFVGCSSNAPLKETVWTPVKIENQGDIGLVQDQPVWFSVNDDNSVVGNTGVNLLVSKATSAEEGKLVFTAPATTRKAGPNMSYESIFVQLLEQSRTYTIQGETLRIYGNDGALLGTFTVGPKTLKEATK